MADAASDFVSQLFNGTTMGVPNILFLALLGGAMLGVYLLATRKTKSKFKPLDIKKEQRDRYRREYKWFGKTLGQYMFEPKADKPFAFVIGVAKSPEKKKMVRYEPYNFKFSKEEIAAKTEELCKSIYQKTYADLSAEEKKDLYKVVRDELTQTKIKEQPADDNTRFERGQKVVTYYEWVPHYLLRVCRPDFTSKLLARILSLGIEIFPFDAEQLEFVSDDDGVKAHVRLKYDVQKRIFNGGFIFSEAGKDKAADIGFAVEREEVLSADANALPRLFAHQEAAGTALLLKREDAKIEDNKRRRTSETQSM